METPTTKLMHDCTCITTYMCFEESSSILRGQIAMAVQQAWNYSNIHDIYMFRSLAYRQNIPSVRFSEHVMQSGVAKGNVCLFINIIFSYLESNIILHVFVNVTTMLLWKSGNLISSRAPGPQRRTQLGADPQGSPASMLRSQTQYRLSAGSSARLSPRVHVFNNETSLLYLQRMTISI